MSNTNFLLWVYLGIFFIFLRKLNPQFWKMEAENQNHIPTRRIYVCIFLMKIYYQTANINHCFLNEGNRVDYKFSTNSVLTNKYLDGWRDLRDFSHKVIFLKLFRSLILIFTLINLITFLNIKFVGYMVTSNQNKFLFVSFLYF